MHRAASYRHSPPRRWLPVVTLCAFLLNVLIPFFAIYTLPSSAMAAPQTPLAAQDEFSSLFGDRILICTADGFRWVSLSEVSGQIDLPDPHPQFKCSLCYVAAQGLNNLYLPAATAMLENIRQGQQLVTTLMADIPPLTRHFRHYHYRHRAPPSIA